MKAIVTGGAGFIGSHLTELLIEMGHEVHVVDNLKSGRLSNLKRIEDNPRFSFHHVDIRDKEALDPLFEGVDWVFHLAGLADVVPSIENPTDYFDVNVNGTFKVLECARKANVKRLIYTASSSCYGTPGIYPTPESSPISTLYPYALTKYMGEEMVMHWQKVYHLPAVSLRLFNVFGPRSRTSGTYGAVFGVFLAQKLHGKPFTVVGDGTQTRDFIYVTDVARAFYAAANSSVEGEIFNVGSSMQHSINELVEILEGDAIHIPKRPGEPSLTLADTSKIREKLNWAPQVSFKDGVKNLLKGIHDYVDAPVWDPKSIERATASWFHHLQEQGTTS